MKLLDISQRKHSAESRDTVTLRSHRSLVRKNEMERIASENKRLGERLLSKNSALSKKQLDREYKVMQEHKKRLSRIRSSSRSKVHLPPLDRSHNKSKRSFKDNEGIMSNQEVILSNQEGVKESEKTENEDQNL